MINDIYLGLHVPKTAGTSFSVHCKRHLKERERYLCSSFLNTRSTLSELDFPERSLTSEIRVAFGHHTHIGLLNILNRKTPYLFTFIRNPKEMYRSRYFQINRARRKHGMNLLTAREFSQTYSVNQVSNWLYKFFGVKRGGKHELTSEILLGCFDCVIDLDTYDANVETLFSKIGLPFTSSSRANVTTSEEKEDFF